MHGDGAFDEDESADLQGFPRPLTPARQGWGIRLVATRPALVVERLCGSISTWSAIQYPTSNIIFQGERALFNLIIKNGTIVDGSGGAWYFGDVGIVGDRIAALGELGSAGERIIDADGLVVSPGFIDIHAHTDALALVNPSFESKVTQGVTTEVSGNCGASDAPRGGMREDAGDDEGILAGCGIRTDWRTCSEFFTRLETVPMAINFATLIGHGSIRAVAMGYDSRKPSPDELDNMRRLTARAMEEGAFGLSSGLIYPPGCYADTDELVELAKVAAGYGGIYASHIRSEGDELLSAVEEAIRIGRDSGAQVQLSHHKATGRRNWGKVRESLALIDEARASGGRVLADQYPYTATSTGLGVLLPDWAHDGGQAALLARLRDSAQRERLRSALIESNVDGWDVTVIGFVSKERNLRFEGLNLLQIAEMTEKAPADVVLDLLLDEDGSVGIMRFVIDESDVSTVMRHPAIVVGSDATARSGIGPLSKGKPHPRSYGTFPRVLGKYVREDGVLSLEDAVAKMTGRSASILSLPDRGLLRLGWLADITIFDPDEIADTATYAIPHSPARGVKYVIVNGQVVVDAACLTETRPGRVLKRK
jgi:N-acyl-D-amino-acid deacylase